MKTRHHVIAKALITAALAGALCLAAATPAGADNPDPNPFSTLSCGCHETAPAGSPALLDEIHRGMREGHSAYLPGLPSATN